jgi:hypothetical protein
VLAAKIIWHSGTVERFPSRHHYASYCGTAPIEASSGEQRRHRLSRAGNRPANRALHLVAVCQIRTKGAGREFYQRKLDEAKTPAEARRALKRRLCDTIYRHLVRDQQAATGALAGETGSGRDRERGSAPDVGPVVSGPPHPLWVVSSVAARQRIPLSPGAQSTVGATTLPHRAPTASPLIDREEPTVTRPRPAPAAAVAVLAAMTLAACTNNPVAAPTSSPTPTVNTTGQASAPSNAPELEKNYVSVVAQVLPSVVQITTGAGLGSGVILDDKGDIVTNAHVVGTATTFQIRLANNPTPFAATLASLCSPWWAARSGLKMGVVAR